MTLISASDWCYTDEPSPFVEYASYTTYNDSQGIPDAQEELFEGKWFVFYSDSLFIITYIFIDGVDNNIEYMDDMKYIIYLPLQSRSFSFTPESAWSAQHWNLVRIIVLLCSSKKILNSNGFWTIASHHQVNEFYTSERYSLTFTERKCCRTVCSSLIVVWGSQTNNYMKFMVNSSLFL